MDAQMNGWTDNGWTDKRKRQGQTEEAGLVSYQTIKIQNLTSPVIDLLPFIADYQKHRFKSIFSTMDDWEKIEKRFSIFEFRLRIDFSLFRLRHFGKVESCLGLHEAGVEIDDW